MLILRLNTNFLFEKKNLIIQFVKIFLHTHQKNFAAMKFAYVRSFVFLVLKNVYPHVADFLAKYFFPHILKN